MAHCNQSEIVIKVPQRDSSDKHLLLSSFGIPEKILDEYLKKKIESIYDWQYNCFVEKDVLNGNSLVISAPTSAGKMLIAEVTAIKTVLEAKKESKKKKVLIIMPFVSAVLETAAHLRTLFRLVEQPVSVGGFTGSRSHSDDFLEKDIAVCTIEKGYALLVEIFLENKDYELGLLVVDELHMIGENRGGILELLITKILYEYRLKNSVQVIGMSATLENVDKLADWLGAKCYSTNVRPIELKEMIRMGSDLFDKELKPISSTEDKINSDDEFVRDICYNRIVDDQSVLIFCSTRTICEQNARTLASELCAEKYLDAHSLEQMCKKIHVLAESCNITLEEIIPKGVGFHHAGLSFDCRKIVENAFRNGHLKVLVATTTLSMGVNLPAHLVIVRSPLNYDDKKWNTSTYKQMIGRAGRKGLVGSGESILMCTEFEEGEGKQLLLSELEPARSQFCCSIFTTNGKAVCLRRGLLDIIVHKSMVSDQDLTSYFSFSFFFKENEKYMKRLSEQQCSKAIQFLLDNQFIELASIDEEGSSKERSFKALPLCLAAHSSGLFPELAIVAVQKLEIVNGLNDPDIIFGMYLVALMYQLRSIDPIKPKWNQEMSLTQEIEQKMRNLNGEKQEIFIALILYEKFEHKSSLEDISTKYDVAQTKLEKLLDEIKIHANIMKSFCIKMFTAGHSINLLKKFIHQMSGRKEHNTESVSDAVISEGLKRSRSPDSAEMSVPAKRKINDQVQENKENIQGLQLTEEENFTAVYKALYKARGKWYNIGVCLKIDPSTLDCIKRDSSDTDGCYSTMLQEWFHQNKDVTWNSLKEALQNPIVGRLDVASWL